MQDILALIITGAIYGTCGTFLWLVTYAVYMTLEEKGHGWIVIVLIGLALGWWFGDYLNTGFVLGVTLTAFLAAYLIGRAIKRDAENRENRDE